MSQPGVGFAEFELRPRDGTDMCAAPGWHPTVFLSQQVSNVSQQVSNVDETGDVCPTQAA